MIGDAPKSPHTGLPGWETEAEEELLTRYAADVPGGLIVEIGGEWGRSAGAFARGAAPETNIYTVDLFPDDLHAAHLANLAEAGFAGRTSQFQADSHRALHADHIMAADQEISLLFIDGDHTYEGVKADIHVWTRFVAIGGFVIFHDVAQVTNKMPHQLHFEVTCAIMDWLNAQSDFEAVEQVDTIAVFRRVAKAPQQTEEKPDEKQDGDLDESAASVEQAEQATDEAQAADADADSAEVAQSDEPEAGDGSPFGGMTIAELKNYAKSENIDLAGARKLDEIIEVITAETERRRQG